MSYPVPDLATIEADILRDIANQDADADTTTDSDNGIRAAATASAVSGLYDHQQWIARQIFPDSADPDMLARHATLHGLSKKQAKAAEGTILLNGQPNEQAGSGLIVLAPDGTQYQTTAAAALGADGTGTVSAIAVVAGSAGNLDEGTALALSSPPQNFSSVASVVSMVGGTDVETDDELLARLLDLLRHPPAGGNAYDYRRWAMDVSGVTAAYVYPLRRGPGTVDVLITSGSGLPSASTINAVKTHIDTLRPAGIADVWVGGPVIRSIDFLVALQVSSGEPEDMQPTVQTTLANWMAAFRPADPMIRSQAEALISTLNGVVDRAIQTPTANVTPENSGETIEWLQLGNVQVVPL
ncbi:baseplate J/gp47 family protein [Paraburkholderia unamae]|uniref:Phage protein gp47/JayE n=1 Tax=Paraburkholderia unamae TaxID=219649 RepID=A0ABX5KJN3_9BURK|nr:baseplate J/gp47 family protein [Paraburkholderia unamae]PVX80062.1 putative phage protein gp47/JayE [Paraburkholderia unamae]